MSTRFEVSGPFKIPTTRHGGGKRVDKKQLGQFWTDIGDDFLAEAKGCYVFAMRAGKGTLPIYVGRTSSKTFRGECFTNDKLLKLTNGMMAYKRGTPVLFLVAHQKRKGKPNLKAIRAMEQFLIQNAWVRNPDNLQNVHFTQPEWNWWIAGVFRSQPGKPTHAAVRFRAVVGL